MQNKPEIHVVVNGFKKAGIKESHVQDGLPQSNDKDDSDLLVTVNMSNR